MLKKSLIGFFLVVLASLSAQAQSPSPAQIGITPTTVPEVVQVLDNTQTWVTIGTVNSSTHTFTPVGGGGGTITAGTTPIAGPCLSGQFLYNNVNVVGCAASSSSITIPQALTGGVSGAIPYFNSTTQMSASALLANNAFMLGGGAGAAPKTTATNAGAVTAVGIAPNAAGGMALVSTVPTAGNFVKWAAGGLVDGGAGTGGGGSLTVNGITGTTGMTFSGAGVSVSGSTPNATISIPGGGGGSSGITSFASHAALIAGTTAYSTNTLMQQGYSNTGVGGAAFYDWNAGSYCPNGTSGTPTAADSKVCILPSAQSAGTAGRYLLRMPNGVIDARALGFRSDGGFDNASLVPALSTVLYNLTNVSLVFSGTPTEMVSNYWFSQPLDIDITLSVSCKDGSRASAFPGVNLVFTPGVTGVRFNGAGVALSGLGAAMVNFNGCGVVQTGYVNDARDRTTTGTPTVTAPTFGGPNFIQYGATQAAPTFYVGDSLALFPGTIYWYFSGSITGNVLTVTSTPTGGGGSSSDPGIAQGQMLQGGPNNTLPNDIYIAATHAQNPAYTGTGGTGTYLLSDSITTPTVLAQAIASSAQPLVGSFDTEVGTGPSMIPPGTTVTSCTGAIGNQCPAGSTMTVSAAPTLGTGYVAYLLPGPNSTSGSQMYNITSSLTGTTYGPITATITNAGGTTYGNILTVSGYAGSSLKVGQTIAGAGGSPVSTTTTSALTIGEYTNIPVASCAGINSGMFVAGFATGGHSVFPPGTLVNNCTGTSLTIDSSGQYDNLNLPTGGNTTTTSGNPTVQLPLSFGFWTGMPINSTNFPAGTTVQSWKPEFWNGQYSDVTMSANATTSGGDTLYLGGAIYAAPSGTSLSFLNNYNVITGLGTGTGGNGTYTLQYYGDYTPTPSTMFTFDTPSTFYVTGGPRSIRPQDLLWSDAFPFGAIARQVFGNSPSQQAVTVSVTNTYGTASAKIVHTAGSGKLWVLPSGIVANVEHNTYGNLVYGFAAGLSMACAGNEYPVTGCGQSKDSDNFYFNNLVGRLTVGDNSGGGMSINNEYDYNWIADIAEFATVGSTYINEQLQGSDESTNTHDLMQNCLTNTSIYTGLYMSGAQWSSTCQNSGMLGIEPRNGNGWVQLVGSLYGTPYDISVPNEPFFPQYVFGTYAPGGIPYFSSGYPGQMKSSGILAADSLMIGGGPGIAPSTVTTDPAALAALAVPPNTSGGVVTAGGAIIAGSIRSGTATNTDLTGRITLSGGAATMVFSSVYVSPPNCLTQDVTTPANASYAVESAGSFSGTASASSTYGPNSPAAAFPGGTGYPTQGWGSNVDPNTTPQWLEYDFGVGVTPTLTGYSLFRSSTQSGGWGSGTNNSPSAWTFQGSNNNSTWTTLDTRSSQSINADDPPTFYSFSNSTGYRYYRINITAAVSGVGYDVNITTMGFVGAPWPQVVFHGISSDVIKYICMGRN